MRIYNRNKRFRLSALEFVFGESASLSRFLFSINPYPHKIMYLIYKVFILDSHV